MPAGYENRKPAIGKSRRQRTGYAPARCSDQGFTLLEILVAVIILGLSYVAILQSFSLSMKNIDRVKQKRFTAMESYLLLDAELSPLPDSTIDEFALESATQDTIFLEGKIVNLVPVTSPDKTLWTLKLVNK